MTYAYQCKLCPHLLSQTFGKPLPPFSCVRTFKWTLNPPSSPHLLLHTCGTPPLIRFRTLLVSRLTSPSSCVRTKWTLENHVRTLNYHSTPPPSPPLRFCTSLVTPVPHYLCVLTKWTLNPPSSLHPLSHTFGIPPHITFLMRTY